VVSAPYPPSKDALESILGARGGIVNLRARRYTEIHKTVTLRGINTEMGDLALPLTAPRYLCSIQV
jgi:hypothetical protein